MNTQQETQEQLITLADHLYSVRDAILKAWRTRVESDPDLTTGSALSRTLFNDHIPDILDSFALRLHAWPNEISAQGQQQEDEGIAAHGLHRWQQGFRLRELTREWGYLQLCVVDELESYVHQHPKLEPTALATALRILTHLCVFGVSDSTEQYWQLQQAEAAGRLQELEHALVTLNEIETARAAGWHEATHDLRGSVAVVAMATTLLNDESVRDTDRLHSATILQKGVSSLFEMLNNLIDQARLDAGHENRSLAHFDASVLLNDFCLATQPLAQAQGLSLKGLGPHTLPVEGDRAKVQRILQNLVLNALKYTHRGGIIVTWKTSQDSDSSRWMISVQDTGPGFNNETAVSMVSHLHEATQKAHQVEDKAIACGTSSNQDEPAVTLTSQSSRLPKSGVLQQSGEGIGLSIVKSLCDLLDATLEVESSIGQGSTFRVTFPCRYSQ
jgi:signal transduction histidine kinase